MISETADSAMNPTLSSNNTTAQDHIALSAQSDTLHKNHHFVKHPTISISPPLASLLHSDSQLHNDKQHLKKDTSHNHKNLSPKSNSSCQQSQHKNSKSSNQTIKKKRKCEEIIVDGFAICAFKSWEDLQDELNEEIAANKSITATNKTATATATKYDAVFSTAQKSASNLKNGSSKSSSRHKHSSSSSTSQTNPEETIAHSDTLTAGSAGKRKDTVKSNKSSSEHSSERIESVDNHIDELQQSNNTSLEEKAIQEAYRARELAEQSLSVLQQKYKQEHNSSSGNSAQVSRNIGNNSSNLDQTNRSSALNDQYVTNQHINRLYTNNQNDMHAGAHQPGGMPAQDALRDLNSLHPRPTALPPYNLPLSRSNLGSYGMHPSQHNLRAPLHVDPQETKFPPHFQPQQHSTIRHQSFHSPWVASSTASQVPVSQQSMSSSQCRPCSVSPPPANQPNQMPYQTPNPAINPHLFHNHAIHQARLGAQQTSNLNPNPHPSLQHPSQITPFGAYSPQMQSSSTMTSMSMSALPSPYSCPPPFIITDTTISRQTSIIPPLPSALDQAAAANRYNQHASMLQSMSSYNPAAAVAAAAAAAAAATSSHPHPQMYYPQLASERSFMDFARSYTGQSHHLSGYPMNSLPIPASSITDNPYGFDRWPRMALDHRRAVSRYNSLFPSAPPNFTSYSSTPAARPSSFPTGLFQPPF